ncbi:hypothetical protein [Actinoplanes sp. TFC3]|uniref:hypothetical protein n=1 Tax=Actinoplanes sp. TFC3 TaxID=1710355 RepID=UPI0012905E47|nr:hypothetical protein [Actinoplanes sp. TFC3]
MIIDTDDVEFVQQLAVQYGVTVQKVDLHGLEPVLTTTLIIFGAVAAVSLFVALVDRHRGGQVIDLRPGTPKTMYRSRDVVYGLVVIYAMDGKVTVQVREPEGMFGQVLESLTTLLGELAGANVSDVAAAVTDKLGDTAAVTAESAKAGLSADRDTD